MMLFSIFFWLLIGLTFVVCFALYETYELQPEVAIRTALPQDPIIHLVEAAFHIEREMVADETAVKATGKPLSLASALLKIHEAFPRRNLRSYGTLSILGGGGPHESSPVDNPSG
jgi:Zn-dependent protease with chaperone function